MISSSIITKRWIRRAVWIVSLTALAGAVVLGSLVPTRWQLPVVIVVISVALPVIGNRALGLLSDQKIKFGRISKDVAVLRSESKNLLEAISRLETRAQKDEARHRQIGQLVLNSGQGLARLEARAHADEMRMRHVGQLARQAADAGETITKIYDGMKLGIEASKSAGARPATSAVSALSTNKSIGRLAAAVVDDGGRARKLHQALDYANSGERTGMLPVGVIGTSQLTHYLMERGSVSQALLPGYSRVQLATKPISVLIIEEESFSGGPWFGADSPLGTSLFEEIQELCAEVRKESIPIYVIQAAGTSNIYSSGIRDLGYAFPSGEFEEQWARDTELGLMQDLQEYSTRESNQL